MRSVAKELGITEGAIRRRVNTQIKPINRLANQLAAAELELEKLPLRTQTKVRVLADRLKGISDHLAGAAEHGAQTAHHLAAMASTQSAELDPDKTLEENAPVLKSVMALTEGANRAAQIGLGLLAANKGKEAEPPKSTVDLTDDELLAIASGSVG
jgi:uncharacterized coiled-coil protein SlyX